LTEGTQTRRVTLGDLRWVLAKVSTHPLFDFTRYFGMGFLHYYKRLEANAFSENELFESKLRMTSYGLGPVAGMALELHLNRYISLVTDIHAAVQFGLTNSKLERFNMSTFAESTVRSSINHASAVPSFGGKSALRVNLPLGERMMGFVSIGVLGAHYMNLLSGRWVIQEGIGFGRSDLNVFAAFASIGIKG